MAWVAVDYPLSPGRLSSAQNPMWPFGPRTMDKRLCARLWRSLGPSVRGVRCQSFSATTSGWARCGHLRAMAELTMRLCGEECPNTCGS